MSKLLQISLFLTLLSCTPAEPPTTAECEELSMKAFRGLPKESKRFKDHCSKKKLHYSKERCHKALQGLMLGHPQELLEKTYGEKIMGCFNQGDLEKFLKN
ncbi:MAG: hypothetical protein GY909_18985 [Oligoflexia bacterium]|nr:hypothetical protein [Oligoflexia bacterium]